MKETPRPIVKGRQVDAAYHPQANPVFRGNPCIEALPPPLSEDELIKAVRYLPEYSDEDRKLPAEERLELLTNLGLLLVPVPFEWEFYFRLLRGIKASYIGRNPVDPGFLPRLDAIAREARSDLDVSPPAQYSNRWGFVVLGVTGTGKTTAIERVLLTLPQVIHHSSYPGVIANINVDHLGGER